jgi:hypothetical protein
MIRLQLWGRIMKTISWAAMTLSSAVLLGACGAADEPQREPAPPPVEETAFGDMVGTMDKARAVEDTAKQRMDQLNDALENNESN